MNIVERLRQVLPGLLLCGMVGAVQAAVVIPTGPPSVIPPTQNLNTGLLDQGWNIGAITGALGTVVASFDATAGTVACTSAGVCAPNTPGNFRKAEVVTTANWTATFQQWVLTPVAGPSHWTQPGLGSGGAPVASGNGTTNPVDPLGLIFVYKITHNGAGSLPLTLDISRFSEQFYGGFLTSAGYDRTPTDNTLPGDRRPASVENVGGVTAFLFTTPIPGGGPGPGPLLSGESSPFLVIYTDAHFFNDGGLMSAQGGSTGQAPGFQPTIPEPETYAMMLAGLGLMGFVARRRKQRTV